MRNPQRFIAAATLACLTQFIQPATAGTKVPVQIGIASWYGKQHQGLKTANGEIFDPFAITAAHRSLPFNTLVRVTELKSGNSLLVRINDRGPGVRGRIIDLSDTAAALLGIRGSGLAKVRVEVVGRAT